MTWTDNDLEKLYVWAKSLLSNLSKLPNDGSLDLGAEVELTHLRIEKSAEVDASLAGTQADDDPLSALSGAGGASPDPQTERLSAIIDRSTSGTRSTSQSPMPCCSSSSRVIGWLTPNWRRRPGPTRSTTS